MPDVRTLALLGGVLLLLAAAAGAVRFLKSRTDSGLDAAVLQTLSHRVRFWFLLFLVLAGAFLLGRWATIVMFGLLAFWALREFITLTPTRPGDHRTLFWVFFLIPLLQFVLVGLNWYELYSILIPVFAFLLLPAHIALAGDYKRFLERTAKIEAGLLICVYCLSFAPALLMLPFPGEDPFAGPRLLLFFVLIAQLGDALQYAWAQLPSKHFIVPAINPNKTWEGLIGGVGTVTLLGATLWWATPFGGRWWWMAGLMALLIALMGFAGSLTMSAIKRDRGVKDYGTLVEGHGGVLDRIDSICFAAPVVFFLTKFWLGWPAAG